MQDLIKLFVLEILYNLLPVVEAPIIGFLAVRYPILAYLIQLQNLQ